MLQAQLLWLQFSATKILSSSSLLPGVSNVLDCHQTTTLYRPWGRSRLLAVGLSKWAHLVSSPKQPWGQSKLWKDLEGTTSLPQLSGGLEEQSGSTPAHGTFGWLLLVPHHSHQWSSDHSNWFASPHFLKNTGNKSTAYYIFTNFQKRNKEHNVPWFVLIWESSKVGAITNSMIITSKSAHRLSYLNQVSWL